MASGLSHRTRYDTNDVKRLLIRALRPPPRYMLSIQNANFCYRDDAAYPAEVLGPRLWRELAFDADASHLSAESLLAARQVLRCNVASERIADPTSRSFIEGFYGLLASFMEMMPASTGTGAQELPMAYVTSAVRRFLYAAEESAPQDMAMLAELAAGCVDKCGLREALETLGNPEVDARRKSRQLRRLEW